MDVYIQGSKLLGQRKLLKQRDSGLHRSFRPNRARDVTRPAPIDGSRNQGLYCRDIQLQHAVLRAQIECDVVPRRRPRGEEGRIGGVLARRPDTDAREIAARNEDLSVLGGVGADVLNAIGGEEVEPDDGVGPDAAVAPVPGYDVLGEGLVAPVLKIGIR